MPLQLPNLTDSPPGGWRYRVPETGQIFKGVSEYQLLSQLEAHYKANQLPIPGDLRSLVHTYICTLENTYCTDAAGQKPLKWIASLAHDFSTVLQGTRTLGSWLLGGAKLVDPPLAEKRAQICSTCLFNVQPEGCTSCNSKAMREAVNRVVGNRRTKLHDQLRSCHICHCNLQAKVQLPISALWPHMNADQKNRLPPSCWLVQEAEAS